MSSVWKQERLEDGTITAQLELRGVRNRFIFAVAEVELGLYFDTSAMIITLILLGRFLETRARGQTFEAIKKLIGLDPKTALIPVAAYYSPQTSAGKLTPSFPAFGCQ